MHSREVEEALRSRGKRRARWRLLAKRLASEVETPYDLRERALQFAVMVVEFVESLPPGIVSQEVGRQLVKSGTSVGANFEEGDVAESARDRAHKFSIARKEAMESRHWCRVIGKAAVGEPDAAAYLADEALQLVRILSKMIQGAKRAQ
ncbi:MAG: four helix bundle protein [Anaerolineae bacterium]|nr:four helix bundle protein [Anaerolineae bacterium]